MREALFQVVESRHAGDRVHVTGRNCGADLQVGDVFSESSPWQSPSRTPVSLRVERILFYGNCMNQIGPGLTAELELSGSDAKLLTGHVELHGLMQSILGPLAVVGPGKSHMRRV